MNKELMKEIDLYFKIRNLENVDHDFQLIMKQNHIYFNKYFINLSDDEFLFLNEFTDISTKTQDYLKLHHLTENQYYAKQRKILRKIMNNKNGTYSI